MLKAIQFKVKTREGLFDNTRTVNVWFEHTRDALAEVDEIIKEVKKILNKAQYSYSSNSWVEVLGLDEGYGVIDFTRYIIEYGYRLEKRVWNGQHYELESTTEYAKKNNEADKAKLNKALGDYLLRDVTKIMIEHGTVTYVPVSI